MALRAASQLSATAAPPSLSADLAFACSLPPEHFAAFCAAGREVLLQGSEDGLAKIEDMPMIRKAAKTIGADVAAVGACVRALSHVLVSGATLGRAADELLHGLDVELPAASQQSLVAFYEDVAAELERETRRGLALPRYRGIEWRLQVTLGGRHVPRQAPHPNVLLRLHTSSTSTTSATSTTTSTSTSASALEPPPQQHLVTADLTTLRRLASELDGALSEDKSSHSRRIARRL